MALTRRKEKPPPTWGDRVWTWLNRFSFYVYTALVVFLLLIGVLWKRVFVTVPPGHHGVMFRQFGEGTVTDKVWGEGLHVIPPWDELTFYEGRLQQRKIQIDILSDEGLTLGINVSIRFRPNHCLLGYLHQDIGPEYFERLVRPEVEAHVRQTFGNRPAYEIYAGAKDVVQELRQVPMVTRLDDRRDATLPSLLPSEKAADDVRDLFDEECRARLQDPREGYMDVQELKLIDVDLPEMVMATIAEKYRQEQLKLEYEHRIEREQQEAERKRIEAKGIRDYNAIAGEVSSDLLRWRDVEATMELAKSPSSKVILLGGGGSSQTPLMFNLGADTTAPPAPAVPPDDGTKPPLSGGP